MLSAIRDLDLTNLSLPSDKLNKLFEVSMKEWKGEVEEIKNFLQTYRGHLPYEIWNQFTALDRQARRA